MKITVDHYNWMQEIIDSVVADRSINLRRVYAGYKEEGHNNTRFMHDVWYACSGEARNQWYDEVYQYANDNHITTALKKYFKHIIN